MQAGIPRYYQTKLMSRRFRRIMRAFVPPAAELLTRHRAGDPKSGSIRRSALPAAPWRGTLVAIRGSGWCRLRW